MYQIQAVANGWIVQPSFNYSNDRVASSTQIHVFNNFYELSAWLESNLPIVNQSVKG